jgi:menaquinone-dependent protoporphyrinogen oxidase
MSSPVLFCYASHDGQTRRIARRIVARMETRGVAADLVDLAERQPDAAEVAAAPAVVVIAAIRYGHHLPPARAFVDAHRERLGQKPLAMVSVNLTARKPEKRTVAGSVYLRKWVETSGLRPEIATAVAGMLDYPRYGWFDRTMIRLIMKITGGPTDPKLTVEFTDWDLVDKLGDEIAALAPTAPGVA